MLGRGRSFIRFALLEQQLGRYVEELTANTALTEAWYGDESIMRKADDREVR